MPTRLDGAIEIPRPIASVFEFVADSRNDPGWCERVAWCRQVEGDGPGPDARYEALHRPSGYPWAHIRRIEVLAFDPPRHIRWLQADRLGSFDIGYHLEPTARGTRLRQRDEIDWRLPLMGLVGKRIVRRHIGEQLRALRALLEAAPARAGVRPGPTRAAPGSRA
jgi:hypothetical protein